MFRMICKIVPILVGGVLYSASLIAQNPEAWFDFGYIKNANAWLTSENAAGLNSLQVDKASVAEVYFNKSNGEFINYYQSDNSYTFGGLTESFFRLNKKTVLYGKINYTNFSGKHMGGSAFIDPYYNPFDIVEFADSTAGDKEMETYHLAGALSMQVWRDLILGARIDYKTASYFKTKDLRHTNDLMDLSVTAGLRYRISPGADAGMNYFYRRSTEGIEFRSFGNTDEPFNSLISFGSFLGRQERFGESGYTDATSNIPLFNEFQGLSLQLEISLCADLRFFNELGLKWRDGYYGERSSTSVTFTEHSSDIYQYRGVFSLEKNSSLHLLEINLEQESLENFENAYRKETIPGGSTTIVYYGETRMLDRKMFLVSAGYTGNLQVKNNNPAWVLKANAAFSDREQTVSVYPDYRKQTINQFHVEVSARRNMIRRDHMYSLYLGSGYASGGGTEQHDGKYGSGESSAVSLDRYLHREYEYLTAPRVMGNAGFRYTRLMANSMKIYGDVRYSFTKAASIDHLEGDTFQNLSLTVGCTF
jgi:hypothetical protein